MSCQPLSPPTQSASSIPAADADTPPQHLLLLTLSSAASICDMRLHFWQAHSATFSFTVEAQSLGVAAWRTLFAEPDAAHAGDVRFIFGDAPLVRNITKLRLRYGSGLHTAPTLSAIHLSGAPIPDASAPSSGSAWLTAMHEGEHRIFSPGRFAVQYNGASEMFEFSDLSQRQAVHPSSNIYVDTSRGAIELRRDPAKWAANNSPRFFVGMPPPPAPPSPTPADHAYRPLFLLGGSVSFTVDVSQVGCSCIAAVYLVSMPIVQPLIIPLT